jgi:hypothetical protein
MDELWFVYVCGRYIELIHGLCKATFKVGGHHFKGIEWDKYG